ncbi:Gfo/Idh/MocA family protein [Nocardiopsis sediminis]|uniref:Gfo/Idh/MocA family protein n=1 Tax=Nocardiopsis sediminis TaxID=1778267 RepID=A0ABV8FMM9_9ACTN
MSEEPLPVVVAGVHGHGRTHLANVRRLAAEGLVRLAGVCDSTPLPPEELRADGDVGQDADLGALLRRTPAAVTILATPIHTHLPLARTALEHGSHLLLEKPPTATLAEFRALSSAVETAGAACQIGFQSLGSTAVDAVRDLIASGAIGEVTGIGGACTWIRTSAYYDRAAWAGRRRLDGRDVVDGALTNPFAHAVATALAVAGADRTAADGIELELFHAHDIESDDTSCVRLRAPDSTPICIAATLCAPQHRLPRLIVHGRAGRITLFYTRDEVHLERPGVAPEITTHPRTDLLENLVAHLRDGVPLLVPAGRTEGFMSVLEAIRRAPAPRPIPAAEQTVTAEADGVHRVITGVEGLIEECAQRITLFSESGAAWAAQG